MQFFDFLQNLHKRTIEIPKFVRFLKVLLNNLFAAHQDVKEKFEVKKK